MLERLAQLPYSRLFFLASCCVVFALSLWLRSTINIGPDTGIYLNLAHKINQGGRYYYDFFESNFPISFYFYALQERVAIFCNISPIILSEIVVNLGALLSIYASSRILKGTTIYHNKAHYHLILVSFFLGFFLRPTALEVGEFGTKTSFLLFFLFPYIAYSFTRLAPLSRKDLIYRGIMMGIIPCIKPHYAVFLVVIEGYKLFASRNDEGSLISLDKRITYFIGALYLFLMIIFTPEFFEFMVPMWPVIYKSYSVADVMLLQFFQHIGARIGLFAFIFLIFTRLKPSADDKILILFYIAASLLILLEGLGTIDQIVIFHAVITTCFCKWIFDLLASKKISLHQHSFIIIALLFLPLFDLENLPKGLFAVGSFIDIWWFIALIYPVVFLRKYRTKPYSFKQIISFIAIYITLVLTAIVIFKTFGPWAYLAFNFITLLILLCYFERKIFAPLSNQFSVFSVLMITAVMSCLLYAYLVPISHLLFPSQKVRNAQALADQMNYYVKTYAGNSKDAILVIGDRNNDKFSTLNYLNISDYQKFHLGNLKASDAIFHPEAQDAFTLSYLFEDIKDQVKNPHVKVIFVKHSSQMLSDQTSCLIGNIEYYLFDAEFRHHFVNEFAYVNRMIQFRQKEPRKAAMIGKKKKDVYLSSQLANYRRIVGDFDVYIRKQ